MLAFKSHGFFAHGIGKRNGLGQQLQRLAEVARAFGRERGVHAVPQQRQPQSGHVHAQLVALAAHWSQLVRTLVQAYLYRVVENV